jgi:hypothetical protein
VWISSGYPFGLLNAGVEISAELAREQIGYIEAGIRESKRMVAQVGAPFEHPASL